MKITIEQENRKFTLEIDDDLDIYDMADEMRILLYAMTYSDESISAVMVD